MKTRLWGLGLYFLTFSVLCLAAWNRPSLSWLSPVALLILLTGTIVFWIREKHTLLEIVGKRVPKWGSVLLQGILLGLFIPLFVTIFQDILGWTQLTRQSRSIADSINASIQGSLRIFFVVVVEEWVFRGFYLRILTARLDSKRAVLLSSVLWAGLHVPSMVGDGLPPYHLLIGIAAWIILGLALGIGAVANENTLWFPIGLHLAYNLSYSLLGSFFEWIYFAPPWLVGHPSWAPESGLVGIFSTGVILGVVNWIHSRTIRSIVEEE